MKNIIKIFAYLLLSISLLLFGFSLNFINKWNKQNNQISKQLDEINDLVKIEKVEDNENTVIKDDSSVQKNTSLNNVDFSELKNKNSDVAGWIDVKGTNINYPFVQYTDNNFYLTHSFDKKYNDAGWLFEDYRNDGFNDKNTIIYAHSRFDKTMFGSLKNTLKQEWIDDKENYIIRISTEEENTLWEVFSIYHIPTTDDYLKVKFTSDNEFENYIEMVKNRSIYKFDTDVLADDKILTLSTCYRNNEKLVLHAKLIKTQIK